MQNYRYDQHKPVVESFKSTRTVSIEKRFCLEISLINTRISVNQEQPDTAC